MTPEEVLAVIAVEMLSDPSYRTYITLAQNQTSQTYFGVNYALAVALLAAHMWVLNKKRAGESGVTTYRAEGRVMQSFGGIGVIKEGLRLTNYGMQYEDLVKSSGVAATTSAYDIVVSGLMG